MLESDDRLALRCPDFSDDLQLTNSDDPVTDPILLLPGVSDWFDAMSPLLPLEYLYDSDTSKRLLEVYYLRFHAAHPILLPLRYWTKQLIGKYPYYLTAVMQYIGSQCESMIRNKSHEDSLGRTLANQNVQNGYLVQAKLLFAVTLHAHNEQQAGREVLDSAIQLALDLGMSRAEFASNNGEKSQSLEESWRRTWWELYVLDGILAALDQQTSFRLNSVDCNVALPCEEADYSMSTSIPKTYTVDQFRRLVFASEDILYSSFAYRIEAIRLLARVLAVDRSIYVSDSHDFETVEASLSSWLLCLPASKHEILSIDGKLDEMLFQAHMIFNAATIYLHQPRSSLALTSIPAGAPCMRQLRPRRGTIAQHVHLFKTIHAAAKLSDLILLPTPISEHTPFFICAVALSATVNIATHALVFDGERAALLKQRVILAIGALSILSTTWAVAGEVAREVKSVARAAFEAESTVGGLGEDEIDRSVESFDWPE